MSATGWVPSLTLSWALAMIAAVFVGNTNRDLLSSGVVSADCTVTNRAGGILGVWKNSNMVCQQKCRAAFERKRHSASLNASSDVSHASNPYALGMLMSGTGFASSSVALQRILLAGVMRGGCAPGERAVTQSTRSTSPPACRALRPWPSALNAEVARIGSTSGLLDSTCGLWLDAAVAANKPAGSMLSFTDSTAVASEVTAHVLRADVAAAGGVHADPYDQYVDMCVRTVTRPEPARLAAIALYTKLKGLLHHAVHASTTVPVNAVNQSVPADRAASLRALAQLAATACPGPIQLDVGLAVSGFVAVLLKGDWRYWESAAHVLAYVHESAQVVHSGSELQKRLHAEVNQQLQRRESHGDWQSMPLRATHAELVDFVQQAMRHAIYADAAPWTAVHLNDTDVISYDADVVLDAFIALAAQVGAEGMLPLLYRYAATCAVSLGGAVHVTPSLAKHVEQLATAYGSSSTPLLRSMPPRVAAAWDVHVGPTTKAAWLNVHSGKTVLSAVQFANGSTMRTAHPATHGTQADGHAWCTGMARALYADLLDRRVFQHVVGANAHESDSLYQRMQPLVAQLRQSMSDELKDTQRGDTIFVNSAHAATRLAAAQFRIVGAPRGSWAGVKQDFTTGWSSSYMSMGDLGLAQAASVLRSRLQLVSSRANACDHPALWDATASNAYYMAPFGCVVLFPGMMRRPFADVRYDEQSLYSRVGTIIAHEFAHSFDAFELSAAYKPALSPYALLPHARDEALADVLAALTVLRTGKVTASVWSRHWAQLWCTVPLAAAEHAVIAASASHPPANKRVTLLCAALEYLNVRCATAWL